MLKPLLAFLLFLLVIFPAEAQPAHCLAGNTSDDYADLHFLKPLLKDKKFVLLGESSHTCEEYSQIKNRLTRFLHEQMDFDAVLIESALAPFISIFPYNTKLSDTALLRRIFAGSQAWHSETNLKQIKYFRQQQLPTAGFDVQDIFSSPGTNLLLDQVEPGLANKMAATDTLFIRTFMRAMTRWRAFYDQHPYSTPWPDSLRADSKIKLAMDSVYQYVLQAIRKHNPSASTITDFLMLQRVLENKLNFVEYFDKGTADGMRARDSLMADNIEWLSNTLFKGKKVIIWAHNSHIGQASFHETPMGIHLKKKFGNQVYGIGFYMAGGEKTPFAVEDKAPVAPLPEGSLEQRLLTYGCETTFMDFTRIKDKSSWVYSKTPSLFWGSETEQIIPAAAYNAVIMVKKASVPVYVRD